MQTINGTTYHDETNAQIIAAIEHARAHNIRVMLEYGDTTTGKGWGDYHDVTGYIGRSGGEQKIPILLYNNRSIGGGGILDHCIVSIVTAAGKRKLYAHPNYQTGRV